jgi:hypothetical protein
MNPAPIPTASRANETPFFLRAVAAQLDFVGRLFAALLELVLLLPPPLLLETVVAHWLHMVSAYPQPVPMPMQENEKVGSGKCKTPGRKCQAKSKMQRQLLGMSISSKRYSTYVRKGRDITIINPKAHGLGYLYPPTNSPKGWDDNHDAPKWIYDLWQWIVSKALGAC